MLLILPAAYAAGSSQIQNNKKHPPDSHQKQIKVVATTYPLYLLTKNIVADAPNVVVDLVVNSYAGCPHDYHLTPKDVIKIKSADLLIINGLGLDNNMADKIADKGAVVDTSSGFKTLERGEKEHKSPHGHHDEHKHDEHKHDEHKHEEHGHHEHANQHLFASPRRYANLIDPIVNKIVTFDSLNSHIYLKNSKAYKVALFKLADDFSKLMSKLNNPKVISQFTAFEYLAHDTGFVVIATVQEHPGEAPSAARILKIIQQAKENGVAAIIAEPQFGDRYVRTISQQTGIPVIQMDPVASGPEAADLTYYEQMMRKNMERLQKALRDGQE